MSPRTIVVSYSQANEAEMRTLVKHLGVLDAAGLLDVWNDERVGAGADWRAALDAALARARVAIMLVTAHYLTSPFILGEEAPALLRQREEEGLTIIPVIARACAWEQVDWLAALPAWPRDGRPVWGDLGVHIDEDLSALALAVAGLVGEGAGPLAMESPPPAGELPAPGPLPPGSRLPYDRNPFFAGRAADLLWLAEALSPDGPVDDDPPTAVVSGLGGLGKTQLAVEFAYRFGRYFPGGVFWVDFANPEAIAASVALSGRGRGLHHDYEGQRQDQQVQLVQQAWAESTPRLLLFDNADDRGAAEQVEAWRPTVGSGCRVLVTSRRGTWPRALGVAVLGLGALDRGDSIALLRRHREDATDEELGALAAEVGDLPLALHLVGGFLESYAGDPFGEPAALRRRLRDPALLERERSVLSGLGATASPTAHELSVARTFGLSHERLDASDPTDELALALLERAAQFAPGEPIPGALLTATLGGESDAAVDALDVADARRRLLTLGLLQVAGVDDLKIHRLLVRFVLARAGDETAQVDVERTLLGEANRLNDAGNPAPLQAWQPHLRHVTDRALARRDDRAAGLGNALGEHFHDIADYTAARSYYEKALAIGREVLGDRHATTADSLNNLGDVFSNLGLYVEARPLLEEAVAVRRAVLGDRHPITAQALSNLGLLLKRMGDLTGARPYYEEALAIQQEALGDRHPDTAVVLHNLSMLLRTVGDLDGARPYAEAALAIRREVLGDQHPVTTYSLNNLGHLLRARGDLAGARPYFEEALAIRRAVLGERHAATATSLNNLGSLLRGLGDLAGARLHLEEALAIRREVLGDRHPDTSFSLNSLGLLFQDVGDLTGARVYLEEALAIQKEVLGANHPDIATSLNNLGSLLRAMGDLPGARVHFEAAQVAFETVFGPDHPKVGEMRAKLEELGEG